MALQWDIEHVKYCLSDYVTCYVVRCRRIGQLYTTRTTLERQSRCGSKKSTAAYSVLCFVLKKKILASSDLLPNISSVGEQS